MLKNYFKIAIRQLQKQKMFAAIKIGGFALSIAACMLIALYIHYELSYDQFGPETDPVYRLVENYLDKGVLQKGTDAPPPSARAIKNDFPEVENSGRLMANNLFRGAGSNYFRPAGQEQDTYEQGFAYADPQMLGILKKSIVHGSQRDALKDPLTMVITKKKADKYFPGQDPIGKLVYLNDELDRPYRIGGVMQDNPDNSHFQYDFLLTLSGIEFWKGEQTDWGSSNYTNYIVLKKGTDPAKFEKKLTRQILTKYYIPMLLSAGYKNPEEEAKKASLHLQPVGDIHLRSYDIQEDIPHGDIRFVWLFGAVASFILIIACINFINLSTAKSANRAKEVGLRKVVGSYRNNLVRQFLTESMVYSFLSVGLGILIAAILLPYFNNLSGKSLTIPWLAWWLGPLLIVTAFFVGLLAGLYPAFYLSSFNPVQVMKGQLSRGSRNSFLRNFLVVFQFSTSIILIISTVVIYRQMRYLLDKKVGFEKDQVIMVEGTNTLGNSVKNFKDQLMGISSVKSVSISDYLPVAGTKRNGNTFYVVGKEQGENGVGGQFWQIDADYIKTFGMKIVAGRNFSPAMPSDSQAVIINQTLANQLHLTDPIGKKITNGDKFTVIGVVQDFNFESLRDHINGLCLHLDLSSSIVSIKVSTADMGRVLTSITSVWKKFEPHQPIRYSFLDERFANMYADVQRTGNIFGNFSILAIIIACLGLFALSAFMAEQRRKEIGVRKVLGATISNITSLLSRDFLKLVGISIVLASPLAWWGMHVWLQDFAYQTPISWWIFPVSALAAISIALFTVSFQSIRAAVANPSDSLKTE